MANRSDIDGESIAIWGIGHGAGVVVQAGAYDKRAKAVMGVSPFFSGEVDMLRFPPGAYQDAWEERVARIGSPSLEQKYVPIFAESMEMAEKRPTGQHHWKPSRLFPEINFQATLRRRRDALGEQVDSGEFILAEQVRADYIDTFDLASPSVLGRN